MVVASKRLFMFCRRFVELTTQYHCDLYTKNQAYQKNILQPLQPRSVYDSVKDLGHTHLLDLVPYIPPPAKTRPASSQESRLCVVS